MDRIIDTVDSGVAPLEIEGWYSTEDLYQRLVAKGIDLTYSAFYGRLQRLSKRGGDREREIWEVCVLEGSAEVRKRAGFPALFMSPNLRGLTRG